MKKKMLFLLINLFLSFSCYTEEKILKVEFKPNADFSNDITFITSNGYSRYENFVYSLEKGKKIFFTSMIPKTGVLEGEYLLLIYKDNMCIGQYEIVSNDYVYNKLKDCFQEVPNVLNNLRAILFIEYLRKI